MGNKTIIIISIVLGLLIFSFVWGFSYRAGINHCEKKNDQIIEELEQKEVFLKKCKTELEIINSSLQNINNCPTNLSNCIGELEDCERPEDYNIFSILLKLNKKNIMFFLIFYPIYVVFSIVLIFPITLSLFKIKFELSDKALLWLIIFIILLMPIVLILVLGAK